jgi:hypothetical protein
MNLNPFLAATPRGPGPEGLGENLRDVCMALHPDFAEACALHWHADRVRACGQVCPGSESVQLRV